MPSLCFEASCETIFGQRVLIVGDLPCFGAWDPRCSCVELITDEKSYPRWAGACELPVDKALRYKAVKVDSDGSIWWEDQIEDRVHSVGPNAVSLKFEFNRPRVICAIDAGPEQKLELNVEQLQAARKILEAALAKANDETAEASQRAAAAERRARDLEDALAARERDLSEAKRNALEVERFAKDMERFLPELEEAKIHAAQLQAMLEARDSVAKEELLEAESRTAELEAALAQAELATAQAEKQLQELAAALAGMEQAAAEAQKDASTVEELKSLLVEKDRNSVAAQERMVEAEQRFAAAEERLAEAEGRAAEAEHRAEDAEQRCGAAEDRMMSASDVLGEATGRAAEVLQRMASLKGQNGTLSPRSNLSTAASAATSVSCTPRILSKKDLHEYQTPSPETSTSTPEAPTGVFQRFTPRGLSAVWTMVSGTQKNEEDVTPRGARVTTNGATVLCNAQVVNNATVRAPVTPAEQMPAYSAEVFRRRRIIFGAEAQAYGTTSPMVKPQAGALSPFSPRA